mgnify:CR=1 FL=1
MDKRTALEQEIYSSIKNIDLIAENITINSPKSIAWFRNIAINKILRTTSVSRRYSTGNLYTFYYKAKTKTLPIWDKIPLILILKSSRNSFVGINIHYLPPDFRIRIFVDLLKQHYSTKGGEVKIKVSMNELVNLPNFELLIHKYNKPQVQSLLYKIPFNEWGAAVALPMASFVIQPQYIKKGSKIGKIIKSVTNQKSIRSVKNYIKREKTEL